MSNEMPKMINMAQGKAETKSRNGPRIVKRKGKKVTLMESVAESTEWKNSLGAAMVASSRLKPIPNLSI